MKLILIYLIASSEGRVQCLPDFAEQNRLDSRTNELK